jgi:FkbM family methyltransferase
MKRYLNSFKNVSNWWLHFLVKLGLAKSDPLIFRGRNNIVFEVPERLLHEFKEIFFEEAYFVGLKRRLPNSPIIIDIGANAGFFTMLAASKYPNATIFAYEPMRDNYNQLKRNIRLNENTDIKCFQKAVYGYSGEVLINFNTSDTFTTSATVIQHSPVQNDTAGIRVPCISMFDIFAGNNLSYCDLLKLDCEGAEYEILYNCSDKCLARIKQIALEVHKGSKPDQNIVALREYLLKHNFKVHQIPKKIHMLWAWR